MIDMALISYFLGIEVTKTKDDIFISHNKYTSDVLKKIQNGI
jgi:hypothetical protein